MSGATGYEVDVKGPKGWSTHTTTSTTWLDPDPAAEATYRVRTMFGTWNSSPVAVNVTPACP